MRIKDRITQDEFARYFNNFFLLLIKKCVGATNENLNLILGFKGLTLQPLRVTIA